jgi:hypothetical protein
MGGQAGNFFLAHERTAGIRLINIGNQIKEGSFAGAIGTNQPGDTTLLNGD